MQCRINEKLLDLEIRIKELKESIDHDPLPDNFLDEREADLYDAEKEKEKLLNLYKELERVPFEFN